MVTLSLALILLALALGAFSGSVFAYHWMVDAPGTWLCLLELIIVVAVASKVFLYLKRGIPPSRAPSGTYWTAFVVVFLFAAYYVVQHANALPHGGWDAWAIWNLHA